MSMPEVFDPYRKWLGIPTAEQPPNHYRLLGVGLFEDDADTIATAADRQMGHIRTFQAGPHSAVSQKLLNELAAARLTLLDVKKKADYDEQLRDKLAASAAAAGGTGQGRGAPASMPAPVTAITARGMTPVAAPIAAPAVRAGQGRGVEESDPPAITISDGAIATSSRRGRTKRSRPESVLWAGVIVAVGVLAVVVYLARERFKAGARPAAIAAREEVSRGKLSNSRRVADGNRGSVRPSRGEKYEESPPAQAHDASTTVAPDEMPDKMPPINLPAGTITAKDDDPSNGSNREQSPAAPARPSLSDLPIRAQRPQIDGLRRDATPEGKTLAAANARFAQLYGKDITRAKKPDAVSKLSFRFFNLAREGVDTADVRYVLLGMSGTSAANVGNIGFAYRVATEMARQFDVDPCSLKLKALEAAAKNASTPTANAMGVLQALALAERASVEGKGDVASKAAAQAALLARKTKDKDLMAHADQAKAALREQSSRNAAYRKSLSELKKSSDSPQANAAAGKYELLVLGDWTAGVAKWSTSGDQRLITIAKAEALAGADLSQWAPLAIAWWQIAATEEDPFFKLQCRLQAKYCFLRAKMTGRAGDVPVEMAEQLKTLAGYPLSRLRPGAVARYYSGERFGQQRLERVEPAIDYWFGQGSPDPTVPNDHFSARWTGFVKPPVAGRYLIVTNTDDAIRLWVDGKQLLDRWVMAAGWQQVELELTPDLHTIQMEYNELFGPAFAMLGWTLAAFPDPDHVQWSPIDALYYDPEMPFDLPDLP